MLSATLTHTWTDNLMSLNKNLFDIKIYKVKPLNPFSKNYSPLDKKNYPLYSSSCPPCFSPSLGMFRWGSSIQIKLQKGCEGHRLPSNVLNYPKHVRHQPLVKQQFFCFYPVIIQCQQVEQEFLLKKLKIRISEFQIIRKCKFFMQKLRHHQKTTKIINTLFGLAGKFKSCKFLVT